MILAAGLFIEGGQNHGKISVFIPLRKIPKGWHHEKNKGDGDQIMPPLRDFDTATCHFRYHSVIPSGLRQTDT